jgi:hypothetical protein
MTNAGPITGPRGMECVCLILTIGIRADPLDPDSIPLSFETWTVGPDRETALKTWKREHRRLAENLKDVRVSSPAPKVQSVEFLHAIAVTNTGRLKYA